MNKVIIMGNLGQDPDIRFMPSGTAVVNISVATNRSWKDKTTGEQQDETSWHRCVAFGKTAEIINDHFKKGRKILIEGRLRYGSYEKDGHTVYTTEIVIDRFEFVEKKSGDSPPHSAGPDSTEQRRQQGTSEDPERPQEEFDDDIPF